MTARVTRLVRAEFIKLLAHPFLYLSLAFLVVGVLASEYLQPLFRDQKATVWRSPHALQLFAYGFKFGLYLATFVLLVFSSMMFAGEFDRGTIKNLLTRPLTRLDLFLAKGITVVLLGVFLYGFVLYVSLATGLARGEMGPIWDDTVYHMKRDYREILGYARHAVAASFLPFLAVGFLGILVSNWTESSGYAVAMGLVLYIFGDVFSSMMSEGTRQRIFLHYASYALDKLREYAEGGNTTWNADIEKGKLYVTVPLAYMGAFLPGAFLIFRFRNITA
jgi:ABC-type transport system involved in multi-copper enzyme maturation permease subunit